MRMFWGSCGTCINEVLPEPASSRALAVELLRRLPCRQFQPLALARLTVAGSTLIGVGLVVQSFDGIIVGVVI